MAYFDQDINEKSSLRVSRFFFWTNSYILNRKVKIGKNVPEGFFSGFSSDKVVLQVFSTRVISEEEKIYEYYLLFLLINNEI